MTVRVMITGGKAINEAGLISWAACTDWNDVLQTPHTSGDLSCFFFRDGGFSVTRR